MTNQRDASDARFSGLTSTGMVRGRRLVVRYVPGDAVRLGVDRLLAQGFARHESDLAALLAAEASEWTAQAVQIGDAKKSWKRGIFADLVEDLVIFDLIPATQRTIAPTLVIVAARALPEARTELLVVPHTSWRGDPGSTDGAASRVEAAIEGVIAVAHAAGALVSADGPSLGLGGGEHGASSKTAKRLLGWR
ncbi:hypothetical protein ET445_09035 [Agromyces protaetiae]|uniref:Uncharacterized protein n=1 Tax=Agromyces protaetiae TaxID=2509455 RepID=A0A4P6FB43_9MICO|nr:hypothetical protein [Agromyces protaetiae]QAY73460.1 hypothetical protein ET445_09035 [Agromyces protaetiae]